MQGDATPRTELSARRRALLAEYVRRGLSGAAQNGAAIPRRAHPGPAPLSYGQQQILLHSQLAGEALIYNEPVTIHRRGELDVPALERAFREIVRRHEAWRTTFEWIEGDFFQVIQPPPARIGIPFHDLRALPPAEAERESIRLATADALQPFDLARGPMYRPRLVRLSEEEHRLFMTLHHVIFDGISLYRVFLPELLELYEADRRNAPAALPELPIQYADYSAWQRERVPRILAGELPFWEDALRDLPVLDLKTDHPRPSIQTHAGAMETLVIPTSSARAIKGLCQEQDVTVFMAMVAAFAALLHGYTGQEDIVLGGASGGRTHTETEGLIGYFLNPVVIRCRFSADEPFARLLGAVKAATLGVLSHDSVPFELLVKHFVRERDLSRSPFFQVNISIEPPLKPLGDGWGFTQMDVETGVAKFDLHLELDERPDQFIGRFIYNSDLFERESIQLMKVRWLKLLELVAGDSSQPVSEMIAAVWRQTQPQIPPQWNATERDYPRDALLHRLFEAQAARTPDRTAVVCGRDEITFSQLNARANRWARTLRDLGVGRDSPVGIWLERSIDLVVAMVAVLKAGGAFVPLDPAYPADRLAYMAADSRMRVILSHKHLNPAAGECEARVVFMDGVEPSAAEASNPDIQPEDLAYILYTSGTTGWPKGVMIPHRAICNHMLWMQEEFPIDSSDSVLQKTSISFDASVWEFWAPLLAGARLILAPAGAHRDSRALVEAVREYGITILQLVPSMLRIFAEEPGFPECATLRRLFCGGEPLTVELRDRVLDGLHDACELINLYGPTECAIDTLFHRCSRSGAGVPIGRPVANTRLHILDARRQPAPIGIAGELHIAGEQLARGYLSNPELTAEKFTALGGERVYRTGDLARWLPNGEVEYLGRTDDQVKLRGNRIELGEIESQIRRQRSIRDCAVAMHDGRLDAYVVLDEPAAEFEEALVAALGKSLPDYMVPRAFVSLPSLPRTPAGKLDRRALPIPERRDPRRQRESCEEPRSPLEQYIAGVWREVLEAPEIGVQDNFFEIGGESLRGLRVINRLRALLGENLPLSMIFQAPTIAELAALLEKSHPAQIAGVPELSGTAGGGEEPGHSRAFPLIPRLPRGRTSKP